MAVTQKKNPIKWYEEYFGLSTDVKPTGVPIGSTFTEYDIVTGKVTVYITPDGTNWVVWGGVSGSSIVMAGGTSLRVTKALAAALAYTAEDVLSESGAAGTVWTFQDIAHVAGGAGYIVKAIAISEATNITPRLSLFLFNVAPTSNLNDNLANTAVLHADLAKYIGKIDFPSLEDLGGDSEAVVTPSTVGGLPLAFVTGATAHLYGILVTRDAFTQGAGNDMTIILVAEQY